MMRRNWLKALGAGIVAPFLTAAECKVEKPSEPNVPAPRPTGGRDVQHIVVIEGWTDPGVEVTILWERWAIVDRREQRITFGSKKALGDVSYRLAAKENDTVLKFKATTVGYSSVRIRTTVEGRQIMDTSSHGEVEHWFNGGRLKG